MKNNTGKKLGIAIIGCGIRSKWVVHELVKAAGQTLIKSNLRLETKFL